MLSVSLTQKYHYFSAVSVDVEEKLYTAANERGIACITISQRLALTQFHTQELRLGKCRAPSAAAPASLLNMFSC